MAEHFFFDLTDGSSMISDEDGVIAVDLDEAVTQAGAVLEEMRRSGEFSNSDEAWMLIIRDEVGRTRVTLPVVPRDPTAALAS